MLHRASVPEAPYSPRKKLVIAVTLVLSVGAGTVLGIANPVAMRWGPRGVRAPPG